MSTSGSFSPPGESCPDQVFTRAALIALRDAGQLQVNCHYRSVGPTIGTAGNTSNTIIEQHAVTASVLSEDAKVSAPAFNTVLAWDGSYDIDAGAVGTLYRLRDEWNNLAEDEDANAPTVHTQVPWHRGSENFSGNNFDTVQLPGWDTAVGILTDNDIAGSTVDLTGMTAFAGGQFRRNRISNSSSVTIVSNQTTVIHNTLEGGNVNCQSGTQFGLISNHIGSGCELTVDAATTGRVAVSESTLSNTYKLSVLGYTNPNMTTGCIISGNTMVGKATGVDDLRCSGPADILVSACSLSGGSVFVNGSGATEIANSELSSFNLAKDTASSGTLVIRASSLLGVTMTLGPANASVNHIERCEIQGGNFNLLGPLAGDNNNAFLDSEMNSLNVSVAATATAGVAINGGHYNRGSIAQNRTAGDSSLHLVDCSTLGIGCVITDNGTTDPVEPVSLYGCELTESAVLFNDMSARDPQPSPAVNRVGMTGSTLTVSGLPGSTAIDRGRMLGASLTNAGFAISLFTLDGMTKTLGATQTNRAGSVAFDNYS